MAPAFSVRDKGLACSVRSIASAEARTEIFRTACNPLLGAKRGVVWAEASSGRAASSRSATTSTGLNTVAEATAISGHPVGFATRKDEGTADACEVVS